MKPTKPAIFPVWLRSVMALVLLTSLVTTAWYSQNREPQAQARHVDRGDVLQSRQLFFRDAKGQVIVEDAHNNSTIAVITIGEDGFMRSVMRGLARQRIAAGYDDSIPFELTSWKTGYLSLNDPVTGRFIELTAFGPDNAGAFARLLNNKES